MTNDQSKADPSAAAGSAPAPAAQRAAAATPAPGTTPAPGAGAPTPSSGSPAPSGSGVSGAAHISADATICFSRASSLQTRAGREANLIVIAHPNQAMLGRRYRITADTPLEVGRSSETTLSFPDVPSISRRHARLMFSDGEVWLEDLGSRNGTFLNDEPLRESRQLASGDRFQVGTCVFKFLHEEDAENAYHEAIYNLVIRDGLTNVFNRRRFNEELDREFQRARRYARPLALVLLDVDHFKRINDAYGHVSGDTVLRALAHGVENLLRPEQLLARVGGEEFVVLCPETPRDGAGVLAERLRVACETLDVASRGCRITVTCSFGVAELEPTMRSSEELYGAADHALYMAKSAGRNRVVVFNG
jgi:two-component system cell cycle response regulator